MIALTLIVSSHRSAEDRAFYLTMWMCGCGEIDHTERLDWTVMDGCGFCRWPCTSCRSEIDKWKTPLNLRSCEFAIAIFRWNHHCPESECGVREKQEVTEYKKNCRQPTSPAPFHTIEAAEPHLPQIYLTPLTQRTFQDISSTILHKSVQQLSFLWQLKMSVRKWSHTHLHLH